MKLNNTEIKVKYENIYEGNVRNMKIILDRFEQNMNKRKENLHVIQSCDPPDSELSRFSRGGPMKFKSTFFQIAKLRFSSIFADFHQNSQIFKFSGMSLKARGLIFWLLALYIRI